MMSRLKRLLTCAGLFSLKQRDSAGAGSYAPEPIRRTVDDNTVALADDWLFDHRPEAAAHGMALDTLTGSMARLREALSGVAVHAPLTFEAEPAHTLGAFSFDADLFDGEPMHASSETAHAGLLDADLFDDTPAGLVFGQDSADTARYQHAA